MALVSYNSKSPSVSEPSVIHFIHVLVTKSSHNNENVRLYSNTKCCLISHVSVL